ncbi:MAG: alpha/beta fold hydrolase [Caulobacteraceae bacterium]
MTDRTIESFDGCPIHVRDEGEADGPAVVFSHAIGGGLSMWDAQAGPFGERFRVIRYDTRGHGGSGNCEGEHSIEMLAKDALAVMDTLGVKTAHFVGLSQGGMTGMWLGAHAPERIGKLVLSNTTAHIPAYDMLTGWIQTALSQGLDGIAPPTMDHWLSAQFKAAHPDQAKALAEAFRTMSREGFAGSCAALRDSDRTTDLANIKAPTLVIAGIEDGPGGAAAADNLVANIPGAHRADIPDAAHLSPIENPAAFNKAVLDFLG